MKMRTFIKVKTPSKSIKGTFHARYISERERDPGGEEPETRPLFTHDSDGLKYKAADRYLAGGDEPNARSNEIQHVIIAFNSHDARELQKLEIAPDARSVADGDSRKDECSRIEDPDESSNLEHSRKAGERQARREELAAIHKAQIAHDRPYADAVRKMMHNLEEQSGLSDLRYVMAVHRHTNLTHVHLLLRRECTVTETGEKMRLHRLPETFLNGRDERGKAKGGLLDVSLSDALDTMIPRRRRPARSASADEPPQQAIPEEHVTRNEETQFIKLPQSRQTKQITYPHKFRPVFVTRRTRNSAADPTPATNRDQPGQPAPEASSNTRPTLPDARPTNAAAASERPLQPHADRPANVQILTTNLQPILQKLKIEGPEKTPEAVAHEEALKKIVAARFAQNSPTETAEFSQPGTPAKTHPTDSPSDASITREQKESRPSRGR